jgi:hypothetical protein
MFNDQEQEKIANVIVGLTVILLLTFLAFAIS